MLRDFFRQKREGLLRERADHLEAIKDIDRRIVDIEGMELEVREIEDTDPLPGDPHDKNRASPMFRRDDLRVALMAFMRDEIMGVDNKATPKKLIKSFMVDFPDETSGYTKDQVHSVISRGMLDLFRDPMDGDLVVKRVRSGKTFAYWLDKEEQGQVETGQDPDPNPGQPVESSQRDENGFVSPSILDQDGKDGQDG